ncbi:anticodon-binding protein [Anabaena cylindrica FACHB-243]|uniref:DALR anticodon binding domain protein n=1 Tax=Anabaena cylindrica (strain ATCC 27899 / PCC 7122) TaxID=272123 RepID=K9ZI58_ANACC|nr:DALR anticodon binding domain protein [Anabaena cylindrica PCC 7122]MBD2419870.1 anticodon-binding protein [Anabaena cylindrica FACHB-243]MBY5280996.1 anticodon-binding protein [Anabaena sp. CCAP 1446/1C]MBY5307353.1 anticodon-binding protein [Anabaena sp. CCAP 1446/1C]BAY04804.1 DALR anticodon-binding domain-containing protein [Anabaena cylindrica PCC 7122]
MHHWLLFKKYTSIKHLVYIHLVKFLSVYTKHEEILGRGKGKFPLYQGGDSEKFLYISSVAIKFSLSDNLKAMLIAQQLASYLSANCSKIFSVKIIPPGLIHIELTYPTLAAWLHSLTTGDWEEEREQGAGSKGENTSPLHPALCLSASSASSLLGNRSKLLFPIQYAHARCCSLLRLAHREGLIQLVDNRVDVGGVLSAQAIPWLNSDQKLCLHQPDEVYLIHNLIKVVDDLVFPDSQSSVNWEKAALKLSQAFENFWCNCRIWGDVKINSLELAQARLGLLIATQLVLRSVLETKLRVFAPLEL